MTKVFVIGFNKCGTTSLHAFFLRGGLKSVHWRTPHHKTHIAEVMFSNLSLQRPILQGIDRFDAYSDMVYLSDTIHLEGNALFRQLDRDYPGARFILNTRDKTRWIDSRLRHFGGSFLRTCCACYGTDRDGTVDVWSRQWDAHHADVRAYFQDRPADFLEFDIETGDIAAVIAFLDHLPGLEPAHWQQMNPTRR
jgi:hypothetical protein